MITKAEIKHIKLLQQKKYRIEFGSFIVEGTKMIDELLLSDFEIETLYALPEWINENNKTNIDFKEISNSELNTMSSLTTPNKTLAVVKQKKQTLNKNDADNSLILALDKIQDPGNLGTIIRIADWFGIKHIICSENSVEIYNPKVIQATMGAIFRVNVYYLNLVDFFNDNKTANLTIYGAVLNGENIYKTDLQKNGIIILGNESEGISEELIPFIDKKIKIPNYSLQNNKTESLNVASAASVICAEFRRRS